MLEEIVNNTVLSEQQSDVVILDQKFNMTTKEISDELDIKPSTVRTARRKAQVKMNKAQRTIELMDELDIEPN